MQWSDEEEDHHQLDVLLSLISVHILPVVSHSSCPTLMLLMFISYFFYPLTPDCRQPPEKSLEFSRNIFCDTKMREEEINSSRKWSGNLFCWMIHLNDSDVWSVSTTWGYPYLSSFILLSVMMLSSSPSFLLLWFFFWWSLRHAIRGRQERERERENEGLEHSMSTDMRRCLLEISFSPPSLFSSSLLLNDKKRNSKLTSTSLSIFSLLSHVYFRIKFLSQDAFLLLLLKSINSRISFFSCAPWKKSHHSLLIYLSMGYPDILGSDATPAPWQHPSESRDKIPDIRWAGGKRISSSLILVLLLPSYQQIWFIIIMNFRYSFEEHRVCLFIQESIKTREEEVSYVTWEGKDFFMD